MKKRFALLRFLSIPATAAILLASCSKPTGIAPVTPTTPATPTTPTTPVTPTTPTQPVTNKDSIYNGVNLQPSYYNGGNVTFGWEFMKQQTKIKTVRIEIEPDKAQQAKSWIKEAKDNGYTVIATYHKYTVLGSDNESELVAAANWWKTNYGPLGGNFIINMMNEWGSHNITPSAYATAYNNAIAIVRTVYSGPIVIDIPGWGQETYTAAQACKTSTPVIADTNIILSAHIYPNGWNQGRNQGIRAAHLDDISAVGRRGMIGEFGNGTTGNADWAGIVDYAKQKGWPVLGWAWNGDGGEMNMVTPKWGTNATSASYTKSAYFNTIYDRL